MRDLLTEIGSYAGLASFFGLAVLILLSFTQGRDIRRLRDWAGSSPERDAERKESTSAAAAERAEEMRKLEEARDEERAAAELRETRRERREAGLPELTRGERLRAALAGGGALAPRRASRPGRDLRRRRRWSAAASPTRSPAGSAATKKAGGKGGKQSKALHPGEIEVAVLNGTAVEGLAGSYGDMVESKGFQLGNVTNTDSAQEQSVVMFKPNSARAAQKVATSLDIPKVQPMTEEVAQLGGRRPGRGRGRRGQCLVGRLGDARRSASARSSSRSSSSPRSPPSPGRSGSSATRWSSTRSRFVGIPVLHPKHPVSQLHPERRLPLRPHPDPLPHRPTPTTRTVQIVKPGGKLVVTLARDRFLKRYHFFTFYWDGRSRDDGDAPRRAATSCGSNCSARTGSWCRRA